MGLTIPRRPRSIALRLLARAVDSHDSYDLYCGKVLLRWEADRLSDADVAFAHHAVAFLADRHGVSADAAAPYYAAAAALTADPVVLANHARALARAGRYAEADAQFAAAVAAGGTVDILAGWADLRDLLGDTAGAMRLDRDASAGDLPPTLSADQAHNAAFAALHAGRYEKGWRWYQGRKGSLHEAPKYTGRTFPAGTTHWTGAATDTPVAVLWEQGLGDTMMCARWLREIRARCRGGLWVEVQPPLVRWVQAVAPWATVAAVTTDADGRRVWPAGWPAAAVAWMFDLPRIAGMTRAADIPPPVAPKVAPRPDVPSRAVVVSWIGSPVHRNDATRSLPPDVWTPAVEAIRAAGYVPVSVQPDARARAWAASAGVCDLSGGDWLDTAAVLRASVGVVSVDTALVHAAGALGVPTQVLIARAADWRWGRSSRRTPWYRSVTLHRQAAVGAWAGPLADAIGALR